MSQRNMTYVLLYEGDFMSQVRAYDNPSTAQGAMKVMINRRKGGRGRVYEVCLDDLTPIAEAGTLVEHIEGQDPLF